MPLTLLLDARRKGLLVILEALAANAGSALTPFGNPQNLFIYWHYELDPSSSSRPSRLFSLFFGGLLTLEPWRCAAVAAFPALSNRRRVDGHACCHGMLLILLILTVLHLLPLWTTVALPAYAQCH